MVEWRVVYPLDGSVLTWSEVAGGPVQLGLEFFEPVDASLDRFVDDWMSTPVTVSIDSWMRVNSTIETLVRDAYVSFITPEPAGPRLAYGSSVTTISMRPFEFSSMVAVARIFTEPRPVR